MAQIVILASIIVILFSLAEINAAPQFGGGSFASSQAGSFGGGGGYGYPGQYPGFGYPRPGGFGYPGGHYGGGGLSRILAYAAARAAGGGYPGQYGGYPGQFGGYPGQFGGYPGQYGGYPGQYGPGFGGPGFGGPSPGLSLSKSVSIGAGGISGSFAASAGK